MQRCMELTVTNRSQAYPEKAERVEEQTEGANGLRECSTIEAKGIEDRVKRMSGYILYVVLKVYKKLFCI